MVISLVNTMHIYFHILRIRTTVRMRTALKIVVSSQKLMWRGSVCGLSVPVEPYSGTLTG